MATGGFEASRSAIHTQFKAGWGNTCLIDYENIPFLVPRGVIWGRFRVKRAHTTIAALSSPSSFMKRSLGNVFLNLFAPEESGMQALTQMADTFENIYGLTTLVVGTGHTIIFGTTEFDDGVEEAGWYSMFCRVPYRRDFQT